jgi:transposase
MALTDWQWAVLEPLIEAAQPRGKVRPRDLRRTIEAIVWRHRNSATWRSLPAAYGPWWRAAQLAIRWSQLGAWERLLRLAQARGVDLGMVLFLDGTSIRAHPKAASPPKNVWPAPSASGLCRMVRAVCENVSGLPGCGLGPRWRSARAGPPKGDGV